jgi:hypothetical protein
MRNAARTDANQSTICSALRLIGAQVYYIKEPVDLLVSYKHRTLLMECKIPGQGLSASQREFVARWQDTVHVVHSVHEALEAVLGKEALR